MNGCQYIERRGETFLETIEDGGMAVVIVQKGNATITRQGAHVGLHLTPCRGEPVRLTNPGTCCTVARDQVVGMRTLRTGGAE